MSNFCDSLHLNLNLNLLGSAYAPNDVQQRRSSFFTSVVPSNAASIAMHTAPSPLLRSPHHSSSMLYYSEAPVVEEIAVCVSESITDWLT